MEAGNVATPASGVKEPATADCNACWFEGLAGGGGFRL